MINEDFWGAGMSSNGFHASPFEMDVAFSKWHMEQGYSDLALRLEREQPMFSRTDLGSRAAAHIAGRMCQKARRAGLIKPVKNGRRGWCWA